MHTLLDPLANFFALADIFRFKLSCNLVVISSIYNYASDDDMQYSNNYLGKANKITS